MRLADRFRLVRHFFSSLRKRGIWRTGKIAFYELYCEAQSGIKTGVVIPAGKLDGDPEALRHGTDYFPSSYLVLKEALSQVHADLHGSVFVDFGCGLGRALLFASELPLRRIIGVEVSPALCALARQNMHNYYCRKGKARPDWVIVNADARLFDIPDDANIFYFFNPFDAEVLNSTIERIVAAVMRAPRDCVIIYANPIHEAVISAHASIRTEKKAQDYVIYRLSAPSPVAGGKFIKTPAPLQ